MKIKIPDNPCGCELKPEHELFEHDWCCQVCGGSHTERICPYKVGKNQKLEKIREVD